MRDFNIVYKIIKECCTYITLTVTLLTVTVLCMLIFFTFLSGLLLVTDVTALLLLLTLNDKTFLDALIPITSQRKRRLTGVTVAACCSVQLCTATLFAVPPTSPVVAQTLRLTYPRTKGVFLETVTIFKRKPIDISLPVEYKFHVWSVGQRAPDSDSGTLVGVTPDVVIMTDWSESKLTARTCRLYFAPFSCQYTAWVPTNWLYRVPRLLYYAFTWSYLLWEMVLSCLSQKTRLYLLHILRLTITNPVGKVRRCPVIVEVSQVRTQVSRVLFYSSH